MIVFKKNIEQSVLEKKNIAYIKSLGWTIILGVIIEFINTISVQQFHTSSTSALTFLIYAIVLMIIMSKVLKYKGFYLKGVLVYFLILMVFLLNYMIFENSRLYLLETNMLLVYFFFIPIAIFVVSKINNWNVALSILCKFAYLAVLLSTMGIVLVGYVEHVSYMEFSYSLLPFIMILYCALRTKFTIINLVAFLASFTNVLVFGARAPILYLLVFIVLYEFIKLRKGGIIPVIMCAMAVILSLILFFFFSNEILTLLMKLEELTDSRFLTKMLNNQLLESNTRNAIYDEARYALENMGFGMYGLFGDRLVVSSVYVHNIFYEILLSFGYVFGTLFILLLIFIITKAIVFNKDTISKVFALFFTAAFFLRFFVSGSFVIEGDFYLYIAAMLNICRVKGDILEDEKS
ncbi:hypothetical protein COJ41_27450 [Bacillus thuringiensis]|uniref:hypothetical protein n=1 Tax=Bacillus cereus group TaxID=86661 RepID=UPI000B4BC661|nr:MULTISPECIES: hypothetical protein [Bacillus cereus group]MBZ3764069.1 hypothetical protein [Bacillus cereus]MED3476250.1 hypothetical protein [Bacillus thuringiensis]MED3633660.1 hypothetical protein [Bacillus thuringiensis]PFM17849.1 hypothetical protein COJ41_27450 [Bacillus thuringiensis]